MQRTNTSGQNGAVSIFVVIFVALLLSIVTISFIRIMGQEQRQATDNDLSQSAYDSAQAGVEDAKRVIVACNRGDATACAAIRAQACNTIAAANIVTEDTAGTNKETRLQTSTSGGQELDQAYTCVKVDTTSPDFLADITEGQTLLIPLRGAAAIEQVQINWLKEERDTISPANATTALGLLTTMAGTLPNKSGWPQYGPAMLEAQVTAPNSSFSLSDLDSSETTQTVFMYPSRVGTSTIDLAGVTRESPSTPQLSRCDTASYAAGGYLCNVSLDLARTIPARSDVSYLRITGIYKGSSLQIKLKGAGGAPVDFDGVQFSVDSTGRANTIFRRIETRLSASTSDFPFPIGAVDITGSLCKDYYVTSDRSGGATCQP